MDWGVWFVSVYKWACAVSVHVCMCVCVCMMDVFMSVCAYLSVHARFCVCVCAHVSVCVCVCMHMCTHVYMFMCMCWWLCMCSHVYILLCVHVYCNWSTISAICYIFFHLSQVTWATSGSKAISVSVPTQPMCRWSLRPCVAAVTSVTSASMTSGCSQEHVDSHLVSLVSFERLRLRLKSSSARMIWYDTNTLLSEAWEIETLW